MNTLKNNNIELTPDQKLWLKAIYEISKKGEYVDDRELRSQLQNQLEDVRFDPFDIPIEYLDCTRLTIKGLQYLEPERDIEEEINLLINTIRELLIENFEVVKGNKPLNAGLIIEKEPKLKDRLHLLSFTLRKYKIIDQIDARRYEISLHGDFNWDRIMTFTNFQELDIKYNKQQEKQRKQEAEKQKQKNMEKELPFKTYKITKWQLIVSIISALIFLSSVLLTIYK